MFTSPLPRSTGTHYQFPRPPLSPPETTSDHRGPTTTFMSGPAVGSRELRPEHSIIHSAPAPGAPFRKTSSITYHNSNPWEPQRAAQRNTKSLIIVIPPPTLIQEHGQLGHTLSSGPSRRLSHGIIMPLFSTLYGQLTAIAREFNFPSTTGLSLYLHYAENGITMTPRISDESWPFLWSHVFEAPFPRASPINGTLEFDIDVRQARWYPSWISAFHKDYIDPHSTISSTASLMGHLRAENSLNHQQDQANPHDDNYLRQSNVVPAPISRHVPRKLSLVDRYDIRSSSRPASRSALSPPEHPQVSSQILSPIFQEEEPQSASQTLDSKVESWRASAVLKPTPVAATGQISLEPANLPNTLSIDDSMLVTPDTELQLSDFHWSISSVGPNDPDDFDPILLAPGLLPSPDIAHRMYEDIPPTPSTATSWGVPLSYPQSPLELYRPPSIDAGHRLLLSRPVTPSIATSWGPPSWPPSPVIIEYRPPSVDLGQRAQDSQPVTPSTATSWGAPLSYPPSPITPILVNTPDMGHRALHDSENTATLKHVARRYEDFNQCTTTTPWVFLWPYLGSVRLDEGSCQLSVMPWAFSWPYYESSKEDHKSPQPPPTTMPWAFSWPYRNSICAETVRPTYIPIPSSYPRLVIYRPVYPYFDLYPAIVLEGGAPGYLPSNSDTVQCTSVKVDLPARYPNFRLYPTTYPDNLRDIYPAFVPDLCPLPSAQSDNSGPSITHACIQYYSNFNLYPPADQLFPTLGVRNMVAFSGDQTNKGLTGYAPYYSAVKILEKFIGRLDLDLAPPSIVSNTCKKPWDNSTRLSKAYPVFDLYPVIYPNFDIYPCIAGSDLDHTCHSGYSNFGPPRNRYHVQDQTSPSGLSDPTNLASKSLSIHIRSYPVFDLYSAVYPFIEVYPDRHQTQVEASAPSHVGSLSVGHSSTKLNNKPLSVRVQAHYPVFDLYPSVYPHFQIWPIGEPGMVPLPSLQTIRKNGSRLTHAELHAMVMAEKTLLSPPDPHSLSSGNIPSVPGVTTQATRPGHLINESFLRPHVGKLSILNWPPSSPNAVLRRASSAFDSRIDPQSDGSVPVPSSRLYVEADQGRPTLGRSASMKSNGDPTLLPHRPGKNRDGLVLQRMRALNLAHDGPFPPPPLPAPRVPLLPQPLNRSTYP